MLPTIHIEPDHYYDNGGIPVFRPTMDQFRDFSTFVESIASYGRKAGLVKVIPPKEWSAALPDLSERLSTVKIKTPIIQHIRGTKGIYTQTNIESRKSYTVAEFKALCNDSNHRPPSRKGVPHGPAEPLPKRKRNRKPANVTTDTVPVGADSTPVTPTHIPEMDPFASTSEFDGIVPSSTTASASNSPDQSSLATLGSNIARKHFLRQATSPSPPSRRPVAQDSLSSLLSEPKVVTDKEATSTSTSTSATSAGSSSKKEAKQAEEERVEPTMTDYNVEHGEDFTVDYCKEVERNYWRNLTFVQPMYGADMSGSLFDSRTTSWNTQCLGDLLTKIDQNLPGVNTPYLYFGMWKATFAWHVEDMDLYSINYLHFGAPKQWYCIPPEYSERFERIAQGIFSQDFKQCPQFLRHKTHLISPSTLSNDGVPFNRLVQHEGEFVLTFPFAYHSGYNLGFNCAESINFALENWIAIGRKAEACRCISDSVQIDVEAIFRSYRDTTMDTDTTPSRSRSRVKKEDVEMKEPEALTDTTETNPSKKRRRPGTGEGDTAKAASLKLETRSSTSSSSPAKVKSDAPVSKKSKVSATVAQECILCPQHDFNSEMLPTDDGKLCHMICAQYIPEAYMSGEDDDNVVVHTDRVPTARRKLKCFLCNKKEGACVQCCKGKCVRAMHASCAEKADMYVEEFQMEDEEESIQYHVHCPTHDPRQTKEKQAEFKMWKETMSKKLKSGLSVFARWNDNVYYAGVIEKVYADKMNCKIQFNDGYNKTVTWKDISLDKKPPLVVA